MQYSNKIKQDWDECYSLFRQWWNRENIDPLICKFTFKEEMQGVEPPKPPDNAQDIWTDIDWTIDAAEDGFSRQIYNGPNFPYYAPSLGPGSLALFLGSVPGFQKNTVWYYPCFSDIKEAKAEFNPQNEWYLWTKRAIQRAKERSGGDYMVAMPDIIEGLDCAASLLGSEEILYALIDEPQQVHRFLQEITDCHRQVFDDLYHLLSPDDSGNAFMAFQMLGDGKVVKLQSDISAMLSPDMFAEFVMPYLTQHTRHAKYSLYHLDGPEAIKHVDMICSIDSLNVVQWVPGGGKPSEESECWFPLYDKILSNNKGLMVTVAPTHLESFIKRFNTKGLYLLTW